MSDADGDDVDGGMDDYEMDDISGGGESDREVPARCSRIRWVSCNIPEDLTMFVLIFYRWKKIGMKKTTTVKTELYLGRNEQRRDI